MITYFMITFNSQNSKSVFLTISKASQYTAKSKLHNRFSLIFPSRKPIFIFTPRRIFFILQTIIYCDCFPFTLPMFIYSPRNGLFPSCSIAKTACITLVFPIELRPASNVKLFSSSDTESKDLKPLISIFLIINPLSFFNKFNHIPDALITHIPIFYSILGIF